MEAQRLKAIDRDWLRVRKSILQKIRNQVRLYLGPEPPDISHYKNEYKKDIERSWQLSSREELLAQLAVSDIVFGGDFHPFAQSQRAHLRLLREIPADRKVALCLEIFPAEKQQLIAEFVNNNMNEEDFLAEVCWEESWGFPWSFYRPIIELARERGYAVFGLNKIYPHRSEVTLHKRDRFAAQKIYEICHLPEYALTYVIFGDLHIARAHLPAEFNKLFAGRKPQTMSIYLNPENVYLQLARRGLENKIETVRYNRQHFAIVESPPWVKWQNYLMYLEESYDEGIDDEVDYTDHVSTLVTMICAALQVTIDFNDIEVYSPRDHLVLEKAQRLLPKKLTGLAKFMVNNDSSFYLPSNGFFYLSKPSVNHAASLAGQYVHAKLSGRKELLLDLPANFVHQIWLEAMGFFLSKFVNPKRKAQTLADLKKQLAVFHPHDDEREPILLALDQKMLELLQIYEGASGERNFRPRRKSSYLEAARFLGPILGQKYFNLFDKGKISQDKMLELLSFDPSQSQMTDFYFNQLATLDRLELEETED